MSLDLALLYHKLAVNYKKLKIICGIIQKTKVGGKQ